MCADSNRICVVHSVVVVVIVAIAIVVVACVWGTAQQYKLQISNAIFIVASSQRL